MSDASQRQRGREDLFLSRVLRPLPQLEDEDEDAQHGEQPSQREAHVELLARLEVEAQLHLSVWLYGKGMTTRRELGMIACEKACTCPDGSPPSDPARSRWSGRGPTGRTAVQRQWHSAAATSPRAPARGFHLNASAGASPMLAQRVGSVVRNWYETPGWLTPAM